MGKASSKSVPAAGTTPRIMEKRTGYARGAALRLSRDHETGRFEFRSGSTKAGTKVGDGAHRDPEIVRMIRAGLPVDAIRQVQEALHIADAQSILDLIGMSRRTYQRRLQDGSALSLVESDRLYRLLRLEERASEVFQDPDIAADWLRSDNVSLGDIPMNLLDTEAGVAMVERALGRIEHGVFA